MDELRRLLELHYGIRTEGIADAHLQAKARSVFDDMMRRPIGIEPSTINVDARTVHTVIATEDPVAVIDWDRWEVVDEVLLMSGCRLADVRKGRLPLLNNHRRNSTRDLLGSVLNLTITDGRLEGDEFFSRIAESEFVKTAEGHLDQRSVGYKVRAKTYIEPGETAVVEGKTFSAPANRALKICTDWIPQEESCVLIGADPAAGTRSAKTNINPTPKNQISKKGKVPMNPALRKLLVSLGMRAEATDDEAVEFLNKPETQAALEARAAAIATPPAAPAAPATPPAAAPQRSSEPGTDIAAERQRIADIRRAVTPHLEVAGVRELADTAYEDGSTIEQVRAALLDKLATGQSKPIRAQVGEEDADKLQRAKSDALLLRSGCGAQLDKAAVQAANQFRGMSLIDMAREDLRRHGISEAEVRALNKMDLVGAAFTGHLHGRGFRAYHATGDFPSVLSESARKVLLAGYNQSRATYRSWCGIVPVSDFKTVDMNMLSNMTVLSEVPEGAEYPHHSLSDKKETGKLATQGNIFAITRQAIINDDLNAFTRIPFLQGMAAMRTVNRLATLKLLANAALSDTVALFHATHKNLLTGTAYTPNTTEKAKLGLNALKTALRKQVDLSGEVLDLDPFVVLCPPDAEDYMREAISDTSTTDKDRTPNRGIRGLEIAIEPELGNTALTGASTTAYYLFANPLIAPVVVLMFLDGNQEPYLEQQTGFDVDGVKMKVRIDAAAAVADHRGGQKATGVAE
jgi:hypothetical protein